MFIVRILCDNCVDLLHYGRGYCSGKALELCLACADMHIGLVVGYSDTQCQWILESRLRTVLSRIRIY